MISPTTLDERDVIASLNDYGYFRVAALGYVFNDMERASFFLDQFPDVFQVSLSCHSSILPPGLGARGEVPCHPEGSGLIGGLSLLVRVVVAAAKIYRCATERIDVRNENDLVAGFGAWRSRDFHCYR
jgi:hypothetical protein